MRFSFSGRVPAVTIACGIVMAAGCSSSPPPPQAYLAVTLSPSSGGSCSGIGSTTSLLTIGTTGPLGGTNPTRVPDGGSIHVSCKVQGSSPNFSISLSARNDNSLSGGTVSITGSGISADTNKSNMGGTGITAAFANVNYGQYIASDCVLTYSYNGAPDVGGIAPGRIWGHLACAGAVNAAITVDTKGDPSTCDVAADFIFENCSE